MSEGVSTSELSVVGQPDTSSRKRQAASSNTAASSRSSRRLAKQESTPVNPDPPKQIKREKKAEKKVSLRTKTVVLDPYSETVVTESGFHLHPNGLTSRDLI